MSVEKQATTKYLLIPRILRKGLKISNEAMCGKVQCGEKIVWVYVMENR